MGGKFHVKQQLNGISMFNLDPSDRWALALSFPEHCLLTETANGQMR